MTPQQFAEFNEKRNALVKDLAEAHDKGDHARWVDLQVQIDNMDAERERTEQTEQRNAYMSRLNSQSRTPAHAISEPDGVRGRQGEPTERRATQEYRNAFIDFMQTGNTRSVNLVSGPSGGFALAPAAIDPFVVTPAGTASGLRGKIDLITLTGTNVREGLSLTARSGGFAKGRQIDLDNDTEASLTFGRRKLTLYPFVTFLKVDNSFIDNALMSDPLGWIGGQIGELKEENEEGLIFYGTGNAEPLGILVADDQGIPSSQHVESGGASGVLTFPQLVAMQYKVKAKWRQNAAWYFSKAACIQIDGMKDSQGNPIVKESVTKDGPVKLLLGSPIYETEAITADFTSATSGVFADDKLVGCYGDMKKYQAIQPSISAMKFDRSRLVEKDQTLVICLTWLDGHPIDKEAFAVAKIVN